MSFYQQLTGLVAKGAGLLDEKSVIETRQFVVSLQNDDGGFSDRAGQSDLYYSLFAHFILKSTWSGGYQQKLKSFVAEKGKGSGAHLVDLCCLAILHKELNGTFFAGLNYLVSALKYLKPSKYGGSRAYPYFLLFLAFDVYGFNNRLTRWLARRFYRDEALNGLPCPALAAQIVFKNQLGHRVKNDSNLLFSYFDDRLGFKVFPETEKADLLSTSVALVALKTGGADLTLVAPACFRLVEANFRDGAFLSGDGDPHRDTEYTFYGLLALGALA
ncbi:MAG: prenyltransferase/squalene oxidase repeat-containing protein [Prolixibacteraceae bacterium]|jgi:hypothetical protein|nr:prenyltransferase/squalene oxidase repeat-containing protein [Prolixibacteraceae bacterium]